RPLSHDFAVQYASQEVGCCQSQEDAMRACKSGGNSARHAALLLACLAIPLAMSGATSAQDWPARTVTFVVPLGARRASDIMARVVADQMGRQLNRTFIVENRPGAGGTIGAAAVARAAPDGYT